MARETQMEIFFKVLSVVLDKYIRVDEIRRELYAKDIITKSEHDDIGDLRTSGNGHNLATIMGTKSLKYLEDFICIVEENTKGQDLGGILRDSQNQLRVTGNVIYDDTKWGQASRSAAEPEDITETNPLVSRELEEVGDDPQQELTNMNQQLSNSAFELEPDQKDATLPPDIIIGFSNSNRSPSTSTVRSCVIYIITFMSVIVIIAAGTHYDLNRKQPAASASNFTETYSTSSHPTFTNLTTKAPKLIAELTTIPPIPKFQMNPSSLVTKSINITLGESKEILVNCNSDETKHQSILIVIRTSSSLTWTDYHLPPSCFHANVMNLEISGEISAESFYYLLGTFSHIRTLTLNAASIYKNHEYSKHPAVLELKYLEKLYIKRQKIQEPKLYELLDQIKMPNLIIVSVEMSEITVYTIQPFTQMLLGKISSLEVLNLWDVKTGKQKLFTESICELLPVKLKLNIIVPSHEDYQGSVLNNAENIESCRKHLVPTVR